MSKFADKVIQVIVDSRKRIGSNLELSKLSGVSQPSISRWLKGENNPRIQEVGQLMDALNVQVCVPGEESYEYDYIKKISARAGAGSSLITSAEVEGYFAFRKDYLAASHICASTSFMLDVLGDSMNPLLHDGDTILVDTSEKECQDGKIYLVAFGEELLVKRVQKRPRGIILHSDNPSFSDIAIDASEINNGFWIHGRVRWFGRIL